MPWGPWPPALPCSGSALGSAFWLSSPSESLLANLLLHQLCFIVGNRRAPRGLAELSKRQLCLVSVLPLCWLLISGTPRLQSGRGPRGTFTSLRQPFQEWDTLLGRFVLSAHSVWMARLPEGTHSPLFCSCARKVGAAVGLSCSRCAYPVCAIACKEQMKSKRPGSQCRPKGLRKCPPCPCHLPSSSPTLVLDNHDSPPPEFSPQCSATSPNVPVWDPASSDCRVVCVLLSWLQNPCMGTGPRLPLSHTLCSSKLRNMVLLPPSAFPDVLSHLCSSHHILCSCAVSCVSVPFAPLGIHLP